MLDVQRFMEREPLPSATRLDENTASAMAKQEASLNQLQRQQQTAHRRLSDKQQELDRRGDHIRQEQGGEYESNKQRKSRVFSDNL